MRASAFDPPAIPPDFWQRANVREALRNRDMSTLFKLLRQYAGLSQTRIGTAVGIGQGRTSEIMNGTRAVAAAHVFMRIADGLDMPDDARRLLGISPHVEPALAGTAASSSIPVTNDSELLRHITSARSIDGTMLNLLQAETDGIRLLDRRQGAPAVADKLEAHIKHVDARLRYSLRPGSRQRIAAVLADASALAGWQAIDMGRLPTAWEHFERATTAAREAGDNSLLAFSAGEQAYVLLDLYRPAEAMAMVQAAYQETHTAIPHQIRGWLRAAEAEMAAAAGHELACRRALDLAAAEVGYGGSGDDLPYIALNETHLTRWRGNCLVLFGDAQVADELDAALTAMDGSFTRAEASLRCDLAAALHVRGERDEVQRHLRRAGELAQLTGSARQRRRIRELSARIGNAA
jgi:transcriptional regulator with XRE-family HTH domain